MRTRVYIDGFNLYYGLIRPNRLHWLDLSEFSKRLNLGQPVEGIHYCTAMVSSTPDDPDKNHRQWIYHQAIKLACPNVEILLGMFTTHSRLQPINGCPNHPSCATSVVDRNEKGSDVNLAARLVHDAHAGKFDKAIVVSGDSDLVEPIRIVVSELKKPVFVRNPRNRFSQELLKVASDYSRIVTAVAEKSQLPDPVTDGHVVIKKPAAWSTPPVKKSKTIVTAAACAQNGCPNTIETCRYL